MHGTLMASTMGRSRAGRKRKSGQRNNAGRLIHEPISYRDLAALQPHRRSLPEASRLAQEADSEHGRLYLAGRISEREYLAGQEYARRVGAYLATINGPKATAGSGRGYDCNPERCESVPTGPSVICECLSRRNDYMAAYEALAREGHRTVFIVNHVVIHGRAALNGDVGILVIGLRGLAAYLRLTERGKSVSSMNIK